jgi:tRNA-specific 2-thiouridylase
MRSFSIEFKEGLTADASAVEFDEPESGVSPGQACVFYESSDPRARALGGGFIAGAAA